ncbi:MAG: putative DCC family thiol-disulfide oxidoreductase YuxK [Rhodothermales bacterium]|jgi:predicted DCC family thiol-disulfide oxidoreductase YuxK
MVLILLRSPIHPHPDALHTNNRPIILFDGVCNLCNAAVNYVIDHDPEAQFRLGALQSTAGAALLASAGLPGEFLDSIILVEGGEVHTRSDAVLRIARRLTGPVRFLWWTRFVPRSIRDPAYQLVGRYRYNWFGKRDTCRLPTPGLMNRFIDPEGSAPAD